MAYPFVLDPSCGKGEFLIESAKKMASKGCDDILSRLWAADFSQLNLLMTRKRLENWAKNNSQRVLDFDNMIQYNSVEELSGLIGDMKFDVIVGNPPYQKNDGGHAASATPIYQHFVDLAKGMNPKTISMVIPSRWFAGGKGLDDFRATMMADKRLKMLIDYPDANQFFPTTEIKGGVCYFVWEQEHANTENPKCLVRNIVDGKVVDESLRDLNEYDIIIRFGKDIDILRKVQSSTLSNMEDNILGRNPFGFSTNFKEYSAQPLPNFSKLYLRGGIGWVDSKKINKNNDKIGNHKTLLAVASEGKGVFPNSVIGKPIVAENNAVCTDTYIVCGVFDTQQEAENLAAYMKTRLFRFLISLRKNTQHLSRDKFKFVPDLPMTETWTDAKLCGRWGITKEEFAYIASRVKEMI